MTFSMSEMHNPATKITLEEEEEEEDAAVSAKEAEEEKKKAKELQAKYVIRDLRKYFETLRLFAG